MYGSEWSAFVAFFDDAFDHIDADAFYGGETETDVARLVHTEPSDGFIDVGAFYGYFHGLAFVHEIGELGDVVDVARQHRRHVFGRIIGFEICCLEGYPTVACGMRLVECV